MATLLFGAPTGVVGRKKNASGAPVSAPVYVGSTTFADGNTTSATPDFSGLGLASGDILVVCTHLVSAGDGVFSSAPAGEGWTRKQDIEDTGGNNSAMSVYWKRWGSGSTDDTTPTFTAGAGSMSAIGSVWRGCKAAGDPMPATAGTNHGASGTTLTGADATSTNAPSSAQVFFGCLLTASNIGAPSGSSYTSAYSGGTYATTAGSDRASASAYRENVGAGATGSGVTATAGATMIAWSSVTVVLDAA